MPNATVLSLSESLKENSRKTHDAVDHLVMSMQPFASVANYAKFLQAQHEFHETMRPVYLDEKLNQQLAGLDELGRADAVKTDMQSLAVSPASITVPRPFVSGDEAIGWLYCVEGSNVGAAILYKEAGKIDLDERHGAKHLAAHPDGRMPHWRSFKAKLDQLSLDEAAKNSALSGAENAFAYFKDVLRAVYAA